MRNRGLYIIRGLLGGRMKDYVKVCKVEAIGIQHEGKDARSYESGFGVFLCGKNFK